MITFEKTESTIYRYFDRNGAEIFDGDTVIYTATGRTEKVYLTDGGELGTDATNPVWIKAGRAVPCQYGIYPFTDKELSEIEKVI